TDVLRFGSPSPKHVFPFWRGGQGVRFQRSPEVNALGWESAGDAPHRPTGVSGSQFPLSKTRLFVLERGLGGEVPAFARGQCARMWSAGDAPHRPYRCLRFAIPPLQNTSFRFGESG